MSFDLSSIARREEAVLLYLFSNRSLRFGAAPLANIAHIDEAVGEFQFQRCARSSRHPEFAARTHHDGLF
jgi:hypothetical protein